MRHSILGHHTTMCVVKNRRMFRDIRLELTSPHHACTANSSRTRIRYEDLVAVITTHHREFYRQVKPCRMAQGRIAITRKPPRICTTVALPRTPFLNPQHFEQKSNFSPGKRGIAHQNRKQAVEQTRRARIRSDANALWNSDAWIEHGKATGKHGNSAGSTDVLHDDLGLVISLVQALGLNVVERDGTETWA